jgi:hypothetical protein
MKSSQTLTSFIAITMILVALLVPLSFFTILRNYIDESDYLNENRMIATPNHIFYDVSLGTHITPADVSEKHLGFKYNLPDKIKPDYPISGKIVDDHGTNRVFIPIVIQFHDISLHSLCLLDDNSLFSYLSTDTLQALGIGNESTDGFNLRIHGKSLNVFRSKNHFKQFNICGKEFIATNRLEIYKDTKRMIVNVFQS